MKNLTENYLINTNSNLSNSNKIISQNKLISPTGKIVNLKQFYYPKNVSQLKNYYTSFNLGQKSDSSQTSNNKKNTLKKNLTFVCQDKCSYLTNNDKKKLKIIINNFIKNKILTRKLFDQEKKFRLNSVDKTNYHFLNQTNYNQQKKIKGRNFFPRIYNTDYSASSMIDKFNNKTTGILDIPPHEIKSKNLTKITKQIINNFSDYGKNGKDFEYSKYKNENVMNILKSFDELNIQKAFEIEKKFYKAKYNEWKKENKNLEKEENIKKSSFVQNIIKENISSEELFQEKLKEKNANILKRNTYLKLNTYSNKRIKELKNSSRLEKKYHTNKNNDGKRNKSNDIKYSDKKAYSKSLNFSNMDLIMKEFYKIANKNRMKQIKERSKNYADSFAEISYIPYEPMNRPFMKIYSNNLKRVIKVNFINKYLNIDKDNELLIQNSKLLRDDILNTRIQFYKVNFNKVQKNNFIRNKLKPETIKKYGYIKDSYFGIPC